MYKTDRWQELPIPYGKLTSVSCNDLEGYDGGTLGGRSKREGIYAYI